MYVYIPILKQSNPLFREVSIALKYDNHTFDRDASVVFQRPHEYMEHDRFRRPLGRRVSVREQLLGFAPTAIICYLVHGSAWVVTEPRPQLSLDTNALNALDEVSLRDNTADRMDSVTAVAAFRMLPVDQPEPKLRDTHRCLESAPIHVRNSHWITRDVKPSVE